MENEPILQALKKAESVKVKPPPNSGIARSQRRSNMFVPLPNKDPLIIQHIPPTKSSGSIPKVRTAKESPIAFKKIYDK